MAINQKNSFSFDTTEDIGALYHYLRRHYDRIAEICTIAQVEVLFDKYQELRNIFYGNIFLGFSESDELVQLRKNLNTAIQDIQHSLDSLKNSVKVLEAIDNGLTVTKQIVELGSF